MGIAKAFVEAKKAFAPALKTSSNPHFRSKYADLAGCLEAVNDALLANGIAVYQETAECGDGVIVETVFLHESGETLRGGRLHVPAPKQDPQGYGSALTYARRYSIMAACGIAAEDDDGNAASKPRRNPLDAVAPPATAKEPESNEPPFMLHIPGKDEAQAYPNWELWGIAYGELADKVAHAGKVAITERVSKLESLRDANKVTLERVDPIHRIKLVGRVQGHIQELTERKAAA